MSRLQTRDAPPERGQAATGAGSASPLPSHDAGPVCLSEEFPPAFYLRETAEVARDLLGAWLSHGQTAGVIVETEAYLGCEDPASHAFRGPTPRARVMFGEPGSAYVYLIYGNHHCFNVVAHPPGCAGAVLVRALEPRVGLDLMRARRASCRTRQALAQGPGRLCQALGIDRTLNGIRLGEEELHCGPLPPGQTRPPGRPRRSPRVGLTRAVHEPLRFFLEGNPHVSRGPSALPELP